MARKPNNPKGGTGWLTLSRKVDEEILIGDDIRLMVMEVRGDKVRIGINAPHDMPVHRKEIYDAIKRESEQSEQSPNLDDCD